MSFRVVCVFEKNDNDPEFTDEDCEAIYDIVEEAFIGTKYEDKVCFRDED